MRKRTILLSLIVIFAVEITALLLFMFQNADILQDAVQVNEIVHLVQSDWNKMENHRNLTELEYVVLDRMGEVVFRSREGLSESINEAVIHRDTMMDIYEGDLSVGKVIIYNDSPHAVVVWKQRMMIVLLAAIILQGGICIGYMFYLNRRIVKPFHKLKGFAERIAGGNLDIPLEMDRDNLFGAFTESFDMMRSELKEARLAEAKANADKKELTARLSHDIKTPVASIKAASEVGAALTDSERQKDNYTQIIRKADQINALIMNLFTATLEELKQLPVTPVELKSGELEILLENADYLHRAAVSGIPECLIYADRLRLQQVFDNIFANSYKYADTEIIILTDISDGYLRVSIEDYGGGVKEEELPHLKEKFRRGNNSGNVEGAGLGLYISDYFMREMKGELDVRNGKKGLKVTLLLSMYGGGNHI